jgi:7-carboxy-7-deazaguanine synthase
MHRKPENTLKINEIYLSLQGESTFAGLPCVFVRLTYCNLRCSFCDTEYAFFEGQDETIDNILQRIAEFNCNLVEITGGEPLIQKNVYPLMSALCDANYDVLIETAGHMDISEVDPRVHRIMDIKCPSSNESDKMHWENMTHLTKRDEVKFVIGDREDFDYALKIIDSYNLFKKCVVLISPVYGKIENHQLADWVIKTSLPLRMQLQMHKYVWPAHKRGV